MLRHVNYVCKHSRPGGDLAQFHSYIVTMLPARVVTLVPHAVTILLSLVMLLPNPREEP